MWKKLRLRYYLCQNLLDFFYYEYSWLSPSHTSFLVLAFRRAVLWEGWHLIYNGTVKVSARNALYRCQHFASCCYCVIRGSFQLSGVSGCPREAARLQWERRGGRKEELGRGSSGRKKESNIALLGSYYINWCVTLRNLLKSHCLGAV